MNTYDCYVCSKTYSEDAVRLCADCESYAICIVCLGTDSLEDWHSCGDSDEDSDSDDDDEEIGANIFPHWHDEEVLPILEKHYPAVTRYFRGMLNKELLTLLEYRRQTIRKRGGFTAQYHMDPEGNYSLTIMEK